MENNNGTELFIRYKPPGETFVIEIYFNENCPEYDISISVNNSLVYSREHTNCNDLVMKDDEEYEKYSYSIDEILNLARLWRYVDE